MNIIRNIAEIARLIVISLNAGSIRYMSSPSQRIQIAAMSRHPENIGLIRNPCDIAQLMAVESNPHLLLNVENSCPAAQIFAVSRDATLIGKIQNPCSHIRKVREATASTVISGNIATIPQSQVSSGLMRFSGGRRTMTVMEGKATITVNGENFDATPILRSLRNQGLKVSDVPEKTMGRLLKGEKVALPGTAKKLFAIVKGPAGFALKAFEMVKQLNNVAQQEM